MHLFNVSLSTELMLVRIDSDYKAANSYMMIDLACGRFR
jgi:hypothetical protein